MTTRGRAHRVAGNSTPAKAYLVGSDRFYLWAAVAMISSHVFDGPLRFVLGSMSLGSAIYLRDALAAQAIAMVAMSWTLGQRAAFPVVVACFLLVAHTLIGILTLERVVQPLFGLKTFLPFLFGMTLPPVLNGRARGVTSFAAFCFVATAVGVVLNTRMEFPWVGMSFETAAGTFQVSRQWWTGGGLRLPGFTRASYIASEVMLATLVPLLAARPHWLLKLVLVAVTGIVIYFTTTKGAYSGLAVVLVCDVLFMAAQPNLVGVFLVVLYFGCLVLPIAGVQMGRISGPIPGWTVSFMERIGDMWPRAFDLYNSPVQVLFGRGVGGIGMAQNFGERRLLNAGDNVMVFLLVSLGLIGPLYLGALVFRVAKNLRTRVLDASLWWVCGWVALVLGVGMTMNMIEEAVTNLTLGMAFGFMFHALQSAGDRRVSHASAAPLRPAPSAQS